MIDQVKLSLNGLTAFCQVVLDDVVTGLFLRDQTSNLASHEGTCLNVTFDYRTAEGAFTDFVQSFKVWLCLAGFFFFRLQVFGG